MSEFSALDENEGYGACDDEATQLRWQSGAFSATSYGPQKEPLRQSRFGLR